MKVIVALNTAWNLYNFRAGLIRALVAGGHEVVAVAPPDEYAARLAELGCRFVPVSMDNGGTNPLRDVALFMRFLLLLCKEQPDVFLGYTAKPNIYGSIAAHLWRIPVVNNIAGLGAVFIAETWLTRLVRELYRLALSGSSRVFFQNNDDLERFVSSGVVARDKATRIPGSGVDLRAFVPVERVNAERGPFRFLLVARMLRDKGVVEYVEAAKIVRKSLPDVEVCLLGFVDVKNPTAISREQMSAWVAEGAVRYLGSADDVKPHLSAADCVVLPSYSEGVPRCLLEAAAMAKPVIASDAAGCRDAVDDGKSGFLCRVRDASDLAEKMIAMARLSARARVEMGRRGREKVEAEFDEWIVIDQYLRVLGEILPASGHG